MKKIAILLVGILLFTANFMKAQEEIVNGPEISFEKLVHDYGEVPLNGNGTCEFRFTNTGNEPLLIERPRSSCGCTVPTWPKEPVLPGESQVIKVTYRTNHAGVINKTVTVTSNALKNNNVVLRIKGKVVETQQEALPTKEANKSVVNQ